MAMWLDGLDESEFALVKTRTAGECSILAEFVSIHQSYVVLWGRCAHLEKKKEFLSDPLLTSTLTRMGTRAMSQGGKAWER